MVTSLQIKNLAVVEEAELAFDARFTALTGETGAGKSLVVDALALLLGARASTDWIRAGEDRAEVSAVFKVPPRLRAELSEGGYGDGDEMVLRREVSRSGGSKAWVNGRLATVAVLTRLAGPLVDLHGQHEHQSLLAPARQLLLLDRYAGIEEAADTFEEHATELRSLQRTREERVAAGAGRDQRLDWLHHQLAEFETAALRAGEEESLIAERKKLAAGGKLSALAHQAREALAGDDVGGGALASIQAATRTLRQIAETDPDAAPWVRSLEEAASPLDDVARALRRYAEAIESDPLRLDEVENRLALYDRLRRKHGGDLESLLEQSRAWAEEQAALEQLSERIAALDREIVQLASELSASSRALSERRTAAGAKLQKRMEKELSELAMKECGFRVSLRQAPEPSSPVDWGAGGLKMHSRGCDAAEFLIRPNAGEEFAPLSRAASGGELSRIMLALKTALSDVDTVETLVFDEVDAGVSGPTAAIVGKKLASLAAKRQVLAVTHLPQIAGFADHHFRVSKAESGGRTRTAVTRLDDAGRTEELARMLSGEHVTAAARAQAGVLLQQRRV